MKTKDIIILFVLLAFLPLGTCAQSSFQTTRYDWDYEKNTPNPIQYHGAWVHMNQTRDDGTLQRGSYPTQFGISELGYAFWAQSIEIWTEITPSHAYYIINLDGVDIDTVSTRGPFQATALTYKIDSLSYSENSGYNHMIRLRGPAYGFVFQKFVTDTNHNPYPPGTTIPPIPPDTITPQPPVYEINPVIVNGVQITASGFQNQPDEGQVHPPANVVDGDLSTKWAALGIGHSLEFKYPKQINFTSIEVAYAVGDRNDIFDLYIDGELILDKQEGVLGTDLTEYDFEDTNGIIVKLIAQGNKQNPEYAWNSISEIKINYTEIIIPPTTGQPCDTIIITEPPIIIIDTIIQVVPSPPIVIRDTIIVTTIDTILVDKPIYYQPKIWIKADSISFELQ